MRIGFDIQALQTGSMKGGIGRYSYNLLKALFELYSCNDFFLFANSLYDKNEIPFTNLKCVSHKTISYFAMNDLNPINRLIQRIHYQSEDLDLLHILSPFEFHDSAVVSKGLTGKTAVILYDLIPLIFSDLYLVSETLKEGYLKRLEVIASSDLILSISEATRQDSISLLGIAPEKIVNIGGATCSNFYHIENLDKMAALEAKNKYGIQGNFILYVGSIDIRKNLRALITAFSNLPADLLKRYTLVVACNYTREATYELEVEAKRKVGGKVVFLHFTPDEDLNILYNSCDLFVLPTLYEGFGLPVLEAMQCGAPVIASNTSSIPEITGRTDNLFDPRRTESITSLIAEVLGNKSFQEDLKAYGIKRAKDFSWEKVATRTMEAYQNFLKHKQGKIPELNKTKEVVHLGMVTTWNTKCGIANYSKYLMNSLPDGVQIKIFSNRETELINQDKENVFRCWNKWWGQGNIDELCEQIVNNNIEIVHIQYNFSFFGIKQLGDLIIRLRKNNIRVIITFHSTLSIEVNGLAQSLKDIAVELQCADLILVHNESDVVRLRDYGVSDNVARICQGMLVFDDQDRHALRKENGINNSKVIATFGFLLPHKGVLEIIESISILKRIYPDILCLIICSLYPDLASDQYFLECKSKVKELSLENHVRFFTDYLEEKSIVSLLHLADILILPYKDTKESASAAIRFALSAKRPVITTKNQIFDDVKDEVHRIENCYPGMIADAINILYTNKDIYQRLIEAAAKKGEQESWGVVAENYMHMLRRCHLGHKSSKFKWIQLIDEISEELVKIGVDGNSESIDRLAREIYELHLGKI